MKNITIAGLIAAPLLVFAIGDAQPRGGHGHHHLQGRNDHHLDGQGYLQRPRRRAKGGSGRAPHPRRTGAQTPGGARSRRDDDLRGRHDDHLDRQGHLQRPWRNTEGHEVQSGDCGNDCRTGRCCEASRHGACRSTGCIDTAAKSATATKSAPTATASNTDPTGATAKCKDGTYSKSAHRSGTCSSHGGVAEWLTAPAQ